MKQQFIRRGGVHVLYDADAVPGFSPSWFDRDALERAGARETDGGRVPALFFRADAADGGGEFVLKHYRRGGWVGRFVRDAYCYTGEAAVRSFREWRLLGRLQRLGLPAPVPCAARYHRRGPYYSADLITSRLRAEPLSRVLECKRLPAGRWRALGVVLRRFHDAGIYHADLNAHNVLLGDGEAEIFLVDFDRARVVRLSARLQSNLERLRRSLAKLRRELPVFEYRDEDFSELLSGYHGE